MKTGSVDALRQQSTLIDAIISELLITNETDFQTKVQLYQKLVKECSTLFNTPEDEQDAWNMTLTLGNEAKKAMQGRKHDFGNTAFQFETEMRKLISNKLMGEHK